jgi:hypothetical protein
MSLQHLQTTRTLNNSGHISVFATLLNLQPRPARSVQTEDPEQTATNHSETLPFFHSQTETQTGQCKPTHIINKTPAKPFIAFFELTSDTQNEAI